jgi:hypothetical protein
MKSKILHRIGFISDNALRQVIISVSGMVIPFLVICNNSKELWGSFVMLLLFSLLTLQVINWGNKEYLLRQFSLKPNNIANEFSRVLITRLPLVFLFGVVSFFYFSSSFGYFMLLWILGRFLNHSAEALIVYEKKFKSAMAIELGCFVLFCFSLFVFKSKLDLYLLLIFYSCFQFAKGISYFFLFRNYFIFQNPKIDWHYYRATFPFFLLSILGFLASKVDLYIIECFGNTIVTSDYQIINSLLVFTMSLSTFIYGPFTKNIYRNNDDVIRKAQRLVSQIGLFVVPIALVAIYFILTFLLHLQVQLAFYLIAFLYVYPSFVYGIKVVNLFRQNREKTVVGFLFLGTIVNTILSAGFLYFDYGIIGALLGSALAQVFVLILFIYIDFEK